MNEKANYTTEVLWVLGIEPYAELLKKTMDI